MDTPAPAREPLVEASTRDFDLVRECYIGKRGLMSVSHAFAGCEGIATTWHHDNPICGHCKSVITRAEQA